MAPFIKEEEEFDSINSNPISITIAEKRAGASIAERRAAKCGFNASSVNAAALCPPPYFTVPPGLSPSALLDSPVMLPNAEAQMSPTTGTFHPLPMHEGLRQLKITSASNGKKTCSSETNSMSDSNYKEFEHGNKDYVESSEVMMLDDIEKKNAQKEVSKMINSEDGFYWRKYGQKHVKGSEYPRSYYKCTNANCPVTKKVERSHDGHIAEIVYKGTHNHPQPKQMPIDVVDDVSSVSSSTLTTASSSNHDFPDPPDREVPDVEAEAAKKRKRDNEMTMAAVPRSTAREPKVVVQLESEIDILEDGYRWRKYGQKVVKGNPNPRSYYKCTTANCPVRKHVERAANDIKSVITTYEGKHTHAVPSGKNGINSDAAAANPAPPSRAAAAGKQQLVQDYLDRKPMFNYSSGGDLSFGASSPYPLPSFPPFHSMPYASALAYSKLYPEYMPMPMPMPMPMSMPMPMPSSSPSCMPPFRYGGEPQLKPKEEHDQLYATCLAIPNNGTM